MLCTFNLQPNGFWKCDKCKTVRRYKGNRNCRPDGKPSIKRTRHNPLLCNHLLEYSGTDTILNQCGGCKTAVGKTGVWNCQLHGLVTPLGVSKDKTITPCKQCTDYIQREPDEQNL